MELKPGLLIDGRYRLIDRLGDGAMGQVWRAQDTRFESRTVAVKFLREDQTLGDDAERRQRLIARLNALSAVRPLDLATVVDALASALGGRDLTNLRGRVEERLVGTVPTSDAVAILFDEFSNDPALNENARLRAKLRRLFRDEANSVANLRHDNVVSIFDYGEVEATPYLVMDYIEGRTLHQIIDQKLNLSLTRKLQLIEDLCCGLSFAHSRRLVHRDIKPANLIIDQTTDSLKILDFGVVRRLGTDSTVGIPIGTFCYMSPEQTQGAANLDHRSDIFAVGVVFYELLTGRKAFPAGKNVGDLVVRIQREPPPPLRSLLPTIPERVQQIIDKAIAKRPDDRYQDLRDMQRDLDEARRDIEASDRVEPTLVMKAADLGATIISKGRPVSNDLRPPMKVPVFADRPPEAPPAPAPTPTPTPVDQPAPPPPDAPASSSALPPPPLADPAPPPPAPPVPAPAPAPPVMQAPALPEPPKVMPAPVPAPRPRKALSWQVPAAAVAVLALLAVGAFALWQQFSSADQQASTPPAVQSDASTPPAAAPAPPGPEAAPAPPEQGASASPVPVTAVAIDIRPWARVRIVAVDPASLQGVTLPAEPRYTPFTIDLPAGQYTLECENGGLTAPATFQLQVSDNPARPQFFTRALPGFSAARVVDSLLKQ